MSRSLNASPGAHVPPPLVYAAALALGLWLSAWIPSRWFPDGVCRVAGCILALVALALVAPCFVCFIRERTTIHPDRPASRLITTGPYRISRNPMYLSLILLYAGVAIWRQSLWAWLLLVIPFIYTDRWAIGPEERSLEQLFGAEYERYRARVRRWI
jgi:protein-S-isoprenylcysteine O-methyltransferase Ste14